MNTSEGVSNQSDLFDGEYIPPSLAVKAMRDSGYKNTAYALAELIDNSIQAGADMVEVFCIEKMIPVNQRSRKRMVQIGVIDNGCGMDVSTLRLALQFGNGTHLDDRSGIGRFGMGLPNASISQCRRVDIWTWQAGPDNAIHTYLDVDKIESGDLRSVPMPEVSKVPDEWRSRSDQIGTTGTLVVWSDLEYYRLTWKSARATLDHTELLIGRMYRKFIHEGQAEIKLVALDEDNATTVSRYAMVNDPLYLMSPSSTPAPFDNSPMFQRWGERDTEFYIEYDGNTHTVSVRMSWALPETVPEDGGNRGDTGYGKHAGKNIGVSIVRAGRELDLDNSWAIGYDPRERWWGVEIEFPPALDEVFGVTNNKQAATVFTHMSQFDWKTEADDGETYMEFKDRLKDENDTRYHLIDIVSHIDDQLKQMRKRIQDQTKGRRSGNKRHDDTSVEDTASKKFKERSDQGYTTPQDSEEYDDEAQNELVEDLVGKNYDEEIAREIAIAVGTKGRKVIFVDADMDSQAFFTVEPKAGGITEVVFNSNHPVHAKLIQILETNNISELPDSDLYTRIQDASDTLKLILAAWARYEEEDVPSRNKIREIRHEWGKMAQNFLSDGE